MKIIYNCYGGSHSSVTSAAIHLGLFKCGKTPCVEELWDLPYYDTQVKKDHGVLHYMGIDDLNHQVYVVGRRNMGKPVKRLFAGLAKVYGIPKEDFLLVDPMPYVNLAMVIGGFTSRRLGLIPLGRPIVSWGTRLAFPHLTQLVQRVKAELKPAEPDNIKPRQIRSIIYCDYTGAQQAAVAAGQHLQKSPGRIPKVPTGTLLDWGEDELGNKVFTLGVSYENELIPKIAREFARLYGIPAANLVLLDLTSLGRVSFGVGAVLDQVPPLERLGKAYTQSLLSEKAGEIRARVQRPGCCIQGQKSEVRGQRSDPGYAP